MIPAVSIVIPTFNAMATLPALLDAIDHQDDEAAREVIVVDSGSTDGTGAYVAHRLEAPIFVERFDHGATRNTGVEASRAPLVVVTVQDARPVTRGWLRHLVRPLREDARVAGVFARQIPRADANAVVQHNLSQWVAARRDPRVVEMTPSEFEAMSPHQRLERCAFDNVCSAIRREVWTRHPFTTAPIAEDLEWARDVLLAGGRIAYEPEAAVEHSHDRSPLYELKRTWLLHQRLFHLFGLRTIPTPGALGRAIASSLRMHHRLGAAAAGPSRHGHGAALALAWPLGQFIGGWTAAHGRDRWRPRGV